MIVHVLCALCALGFKKDGQVRKLERYITSTQFQYGYRHHDIPNTNRTFRSRQGYISPGIAEICLSSITESDIHYRMLATMVFLTFLLKCCVMTQQEGILQDVYTFAGTDQCQLPEYGPYSCTYYVNLYTIIRAVCLSTCNVVHIAFVHLNWKLILVV